MISRSQIDDICTFFNGYTPSQEDLYPSGDIPYFKVAEMNRKENQIVLSGTDSFMRSAKKTFPKDSIVFPKNGAAISTNKKRILGQDSVVDLNTAGVIAKESVNYKYLFLAFQNIDFREFIRPGAVPTLDIKAIKGIRIPIPDYDKQLQIVSEMWHLFDLVSLMEDQINNLCILAQSLYHEFFGSVKEFVPLSFYISSLTGGKSLAGEKECINKVLKTGAVTYDYFRKDDIKNLPLNYTPRPEDKVRIGDLLISRMNTLDLVGACAYVWDVNDNTYLPDRLWRAKLKPNANPIFLWKSLIQVEAKEQIRSYASGTSGSMKNISKPKLLSVRLPLVDVSIQDSFSQRISDIHKNKERLEISIKEINSLIASRMTTFFD